MGMEYSIGWCALPCLMGKPTSARGGGADRARGAQRAKFADAPVKVDRWHRA